MLLCMSLALSAGCAGNRNPVQPDNETDLTPICRESGSESAGTYLLGYYDIYFDIESGTFEAVVNRDAGFTLNIVAFLNQMMIPMNGITFDSIVIHDDDPSFIGVDLEFSVYHPFPGYDQYNAYDLLGVVIGDGSDTMTYDGLRVARHGTDLWMNNPDGYTRWFNPTEFTTEMIFGYTSGGWQNYAGNANLNPYKYYSKHLGKDDNLWSYLTGDNNWDGFFESGAGRTMELEFPLSPDGIGIMFGYAVVVEWEEQGPTGPYYPVHRKEALAASTMQSPDVWYNETDGSGGDLILDIDLWAWEYQPSTIKIESSVLAGIETFDFDTYAAPGGENYSTWHVEAGAATLHSADDHFCWVIAEYEGFDYKNGVEHIPSPDGPLASFFRYDVEVLPEPENSSPTCNLTSDPDVDGEIYEGWIPVEITFDSNGYDPDPGDILSYEWSENGADWIPGDSTLVKEYTSEGIYSIYVRVTDDIDAFSECSIIDFELVLACDAFSVTGSDPENGQAEKIYMDFTVYGENFQDGSNLAVDIMDGTTIVTSGSLPITYIDSGTLECEMDFTGVPEGDYTLRVTNGCDPVSYQSMDFTVDPLYFSWPFFQYDEKCSGVTTEHLTLPLTLKWNVYPKTNGMMFYSPVVADGRVFYVDCNNDYCVALLEEDGSFDWEYPINPLGQNWGYWSGTAYDDGMVFCGGNSLYCLDASDGSYIWDYYTAGSNFFSFVFGHPLVYDGIVYGPRRDGTMIAVDESDGSFLWSHFIGGGYGCYHPPAIAGDIGIFGAGFDSTVYGRNRITGNPGWVWYNPYSGSDRSMRVPPTVNGDNVYYGSYTQHIFCVENQTGTQVWDYPTAGNYPFDAGVFLDGAYFQPTLNFTSETAYLYAINEDGSLRWTKPPNGSNKWRGYLAATPDYIFCASGNMIYALDPVDGSTEWSYDAGDDIQSGFAIANNCLFTTTLYGHVICLEGS